MVQIWLSENHFGKGSVTDLSLRDSTGFNELYRFQYKPFIFELSLDFNECFICEVLLQDKTWSSHQRHICLMAQKKEINCARVCSDPAGGKREFANVVVCQLMLEYRLCVCVCVHICVRVYVCVCKKKGAIK